MVEIKGLEKLAPKDFPGYISATVFTGGCNFRCPFCHNSQLVLEPEKYSTLPLDFFISFMDVRKDWLEAVCITGGEPLFHEDIEVLVRVIKDRGLLVKLDTNGSFPDRLEELLDMGVLDTIAMDVKAPLKRYSHVVGTKVDTGGINRSIALIRESGLKYVFRTTVVPGLIREEDILEIGKLLQGSDIFQLQNFVPKNTLDKAFLNRKPYPPAKLEKFAALARDYFSDVIIEGADHGT